MPAINYKKDYDTYEVKLTQLEKELSLLENQKKQIQNELNKEEEYFQMKQSEKKLSVDNPNFTAYVAEIDKVINLQTEVATLADSIRKNIQNETDRDKIKEITSCSNKVSHKALEIVGRGDKLIGPLEISLVAASMDVKRVAENDKTENEKTQPNLNLPTKKR